MQLFVISCASTYDPQSPQLVWAVRAAIKEDALASVRSDQSRVCDNAQDFDCAALDTLGDAAVVFANV